MDHCEVAPRSPSRAARAEGAPLVGLCGNPNTGKTTLFNGLTGARARVGNYPGVTVERRVGRARLRSGEVDVVDLPGTYSLTARSAEEQIAIEAALGLGEHPAPDLVVLVVDAGQLIRNLYLAVQLIELDVPLCVALNMIDEAEPTPDHQALAKLFGVPFVPTNARAGEGLDELRGAIAEAVERPARGAVTVDYPAALEDDARRVVEALPKAWRGSDRRDRALALWGLSSLDPDDELQGIDPGLRAACEEAQLAAGGRDIDAEIITARYAFLDGPVTAAAYPRPPAERGPDLTERVDAVVLHPVWGFAIFLGVMLLLFTALFAWADPAIGVLEALFGWLGKLAKTHLPAGLIANLVSEGIIAGVGNVVVFLPQILILFLLLGLLEDSGYMSRAAYLMDRIMKAVGLHGRAFVPMLSGCACAIPGIMATRTMERERDRLLTMLVIPLMTCSARLPVYTLVIAALFPATQVLGGVFSVKALMLMGMYLFSTVTALLAAAVIGRTVVKGRRVPLLMELPPYRLPTFRTIVRRMFERSWLFLKEAGTVILVCTIALWALLSYPKPATPEPLGEKAVAGWHRVVEHRALDVAAASDNSTAVAEWQAARMTQSYGGKLGRALAPAIAPLGFDWKIGVGLVGAFAAREVFVSTMGIIYGIGGDADEESKPLRARMAAEKHPDGRRVYSPLMGMSLMVFFALACQCMSTLAVVKRETGSYKWPAFLFAYMTTLAWLASFLVYQGGKLLGFG